MKRLNISRVLIFCFLIFILNSCANESLINKEKKPHVSIKKPIVNQKDYDDGLKYYTAFFKDGTFGVFTSLVDDTPGLIYKGVFQISKSELTDIKLLEKESDFKEAYYKLLEHEEKQKANSTNGIVPRKGAPVSSAARLWSSGLVFFTIDNDLPIEQKEFFFKAISLWSQKTSLRFRVSYNGRSDPSNILVQGAPSGCNSMTGMPTLKFNKLGYMNLSQTCDQQSVFHEVGYAIGLIHENQRPKKRSVFNRFFFKKRL